jgi:hypothetical protein
MLGERGDAWYNSMHRPVSFVSWLGRTSHDNRGVLAYLIDASSRAGLGNISENALNDAGTLGLAGD